MRTGLVGLLGALAVFAVAACGGPKPGEATGRVERVIDGDTIVVGGLGTVRYIGVDTPELHHPRRPIERLAAEALRINRRLVGGRIVRVAFERERRDDHGRLLGDVYVGDVFVNAEMVRLGLARTLAIAPNTEHAGRLRRLERAAIAAGQGIWGPAEGGVPWGLP